MAYWGPAVHREAPMPEPHRLFLAVSALLFPACNDRALPPPADTAALPTQTLDCAAGFPWLNLPVRVHLIQSTIPSLNATWSEPDVTLALDAANEGWTQACIALSLESVVRAPLTAEQETAFLQAIADGIDGNERQTMQAAMPVGNRLEPGWNVMVFPTFAPVAPASGLFLFETGDILFAEQTPPGAENPPAVLAHEFGHSFSLPHYDGDDAASNLMTQSIALDHPTASDLNPAQVEQARAQAAAGQPTDQPPIP